MTCVLVIAARWHHDPGLAAENFKDLKLIKKFHQILKPAEKKQKYVYGGMSTGRPITPPRKQKKK